MTIMNYYSVPFGSFWDLFGSICQQNFPLFGPSIACCQEAYVRVAVPVLPLQVGPESIEAVEVLLPKIHQNTSSQLGIIAI